MDINLNVIQDEVDRVTNGFDIDDVEAELSQAGVDLSQLYSVGVYGEISFTPGTPALTLGGATATATVTALFDRNDPSLYEAYVTIEVGVGPVLSVSNLGRGVGAIGCQGTYDDFSGPFVGGTLAAGVGTQFTRSPAVLGGT